MINSSALVASPRPPRPCHCDAPVFDAPTPPLEESKDTTNAGRFSWLSAAFRSPNNSSAARAKIVNSSALAASRRTQRSSLFDAPLFVAPTPPLHHPMSTASVRLLNKTRSLPISDRQRKKYNITNARGLVQQYICLSFVLRFAFQHKPGGVGIRRPQAERAFNDFHKRKCK